MGPPVNRAVILEVWISTTNNWVCSADSRMCRVHEVPRTTLTPLNLKLRIPRNNLVSVMAVGGYYWLWCGCGDCFHVSVEFYVVDTAKYA